MNRLCILHRTQIYLTDRQQKELKKESQDIGISKAELIRRILDNYLKEDRNE